MPTDVTVPGLEGSPLVLAAVCTCAVIFILMGAWRGWKDGAGRTLMALVSLVAAYACAYLFGDEAGAFLDGKLNYPDFVLTALGGMAVALAVFLTGATLGVLAFQRASTMHDPEKRTRSGRVGALFGATVATGMCLVLLVILRMGGTVAEAMFVGMEDYAASMEQGGASTEGNGGTDAQSAESQRIADVLARTMAQVKNALEAGLFGDLFELADPLPPEFYRVLEKVGLVVANPIALDRFRQNPIVNEMARNPKFAALLEDEEIRQLASGRDLNGLLRHPKVLAVAADPEIRARLQQVDFEKLLDEALGIQPKANPPPPKPDA